MDIFRIITNSTWMVTRLISGGAVQFRRDVYHAKVLENHPTGPFLQLSVSVNDPSKPVTFAIKAGDPDKIFHIDNETGKLATLRQLDYEKTQKFELVVEARVGSETSEALVNIDVSDEDDHRPAFLRTKYETQITEEDDRDLPKKILQVQAHDGDLGKFGLLSYALNGSGTFPTSPDPYFSMNSTTGHLYALKPLDRDPPTGTSRWNLGVFATDGVTTVYTTIVVNVKDINDNEPYFLEDTVHATVKENLQEDVEVIVMTAYDKDDVGEGQNAILTYSLEKNVIDEETGRPLFSIGRKTGRVATSVRCFDRERANQYLIQIVASDGGGLKGTATVIVDVLDENDERPKFAEDEWHFELEDLLEPGEVVASVSAEDLDQINHFAFRVVPRSGPGWHLFSIEVPKPSSRTAYLRALSGLDSRNRDQRDGFKFLIQVTDKEEKPFEDDSQVDSAWVKMHFSSNILKFGPTKIVYPHREVADSNSGSFILRIPEDTAPNTLLAALSVQGDRIENSSVKFSILPHSNPGGTFEVTENGVIRVATPLDRESHANYELWVTASLDQTMHSATTTLQVEVDDVNDNPPHLLEPRTFYVPEGVTPQDVGKFYLDDPDDWTAGNGPPFHVEIAETAKVHFEHRLKINFGSDGGRNRTAEGTIETTWVLGPEGKELLGPMLVPIVVSDNGNPRMSSTQTLTIVGGQDSKSFIPKSQESLLDVAADPKARVTQRLRKLHSGLDTIVKLPSGRQGSFDLKPQRLNDELHSSLRELMKSALTIVLAVPPNDLVAQTQEGSILDLLVGSLESLVLDSLSPKVSDSDSVRLYKLNQRSLRKNRRLFGDDDPFRQNLVQVIFVGADEEDRTASEVRIAFLDVVNLHHLLLANRLSIQNQLRSAIARIGNREKCDGESSISRNCGGGSCIPTAAAAPNSTHEDNDPLKLFRQFCFPNPCFNGGRCIPDKNLGFRCECALDTEKPLCKFLIRSFKGGLFEAGGSWAWLSHSRGCSGRGHVSMEILSGENDGIIFYWGEAHREKETLRTRNKREAVTRRPIQPTPEVALNASTSGWKRIRRQLLHRHPKKLSDMVLIELIDGRAVVTVHINGKEHVMGSANSIVLADDTWHRFDLIWNEEIMEFVLDLCEEDSSTSQPSPALRQTRFWSAQSRDRYSSFGSTYSSFAGSPRDATTCRFTFELPKGLEPFWPSPPISIGGRHEEFLSPRVKHWEGSESLKKSFQGCVRNVRINNELKDLGYSLISVKSEPGCQSIRCQPESQRCKLNEICSGSPGTESCDTCRPGFHGDGCQVQTDPVTFQSGGSIAVSLSPLYFSRVTTFQLRFRTREPQASILHAVKADGSSRVSFTLSGGMLCLERLQEQGALRLCLTEVALNDGQWHLLVASNKGIATSLSVDGGDENHFNSSFGSGDHPSFKIHPNDSVTLGGGAGKSYDFRKGCIDDLRMNGHRIPLSSRPGGNKFAEISSVRHVTQGCQFPPSCNGKKCQPPLRCIDIWHKHECGCDRGHYFARNGTCVSTAECDFAPCLNGGICLDRENGFSCSCPAGFGGLQCQTGERVSEFSLSHAASLVGAMGLAILLLGVQISPPIGKDVATSPLKGVSESSSSSSSSSSSDSSSSSSESDSDTENQRATKRARFSQGSLRDQSTTKSKSGRKRRSSDGVLAKTETTSEIECDIHRKRTKLSDFSGTCADVVPEMGIKLQNGMVLTESKDPLRIPELNGTHYAGGYRPVNWTERVNRTAPSTSSLPISNFNTISHDAFSRSYFSNGESSILAPIQAVYPNPETINVFYPQNSSNVFDDNEIILNTKSGNNKIAEATNDNLDRTFSKGEIKGIFCTTSSLSSVSNTQLRNLGHK